MLVFAEWELLNQDAGSGLRDQVYWGQVCLVNFVGFCFLSQVVY